MQKLLADKRVLVTGASRGLGRVLCGHFASQGATVAFNYSGDHQGAAGTLATIEGNGGNGLGFPISVLDDEGLHRMVKDVEDRWGGIDVLVNNAGISQPLPLPLLEESDWELVMAVNVKGQFLASRAVLRGMIRRRAGVILNIGSLAGLRLVESPLHYAASKAAVKGFTQALAKEVAGYNIRVNCLAPGLLEGALAEACRSTGCASI